MIIVLGATGRIGREVALGLLREGAPTRLLVRDAAKLAPVLRDRGEIALGEFADAASLQRAFRGCEALLLVSPADTEGELRVIEQAASAGVRRIVKISSQGAQLDGPYPIGRAHAQVELQLARSGLDWTALRPGMFAQNFLNFAELIRSEGRFFGAYGAGQVAPIDARDIAEVAVRVLTGGAAHAAAVYTLTGPEALSFAQIAQQLSAAAGRAVQYQDVPPAALRAQFEARGVPPLLVEELLARQATIAAGGGADVTGDVARLLGRPARSFAEFAADHAASFRS